MNKSHHFIGIFLISLATLLLELSLTRVMSVALWYHFGFLVISTALLGFGSAGAALAGWTNLREGYTATIYLRSLTLLLFALMFSFSFGANNFVPKKITENKRDVTNKEVPVYSKWNTFSFIGLYEIKPDSTGFKEARSFFVDEGTAANGITNLNNGASNYSKENPADSLYSSVPAYLGRKKLAILNIGSGGRR